MLGSSSIGQHVRHVVEMMQCLQNGYEGGIVNYDERKRNTRIESDNLFAANLLKELLLTLQQPDKGLALQQEGNDEAVQTTYKRELLYNTEHAIHHMALIRVGISEASTINISDEFGVASSTIKYRKECAQ